MNAQSIPQIRTYARLRNSSFLNVHLLCPFQVPRLLRQLASCTAALRTCDFLHARWPTGSQGHSCLS